MQSGSHSLHMVKLGFYSMLKHDALKPTHFLIMIYSTSQENLNVSFFHVIINQFFPIRKLEIIFSYPSASHYFCLLNIILISHSQSHCYSSCSYYIFPGLLQNGLPTIFPASKFSSF